MKALFLRQRSNKVKGSIHGVIAELDRDKRNGLLYWYYRNAVYCHSINEYKQYALNNNLLFTNRFVSLQTKYKFKESDLS